MFVELARRWRETIVVTAFFALACLQTGSAALAQSVEYVWSSNGAYCARITPGNLSQLTAKAVLLKFDAESRTFHHFGKLDLPHKYFPLEGVLTNDGRFLVTLGNRSGSDDLSSAVVIFDLETGEGKHFALTDIFDEGDISNAYRKGRYTRRFPSYQHWFDLSGETEPTVDRESHQIYLTGFTNSEDVAKPTIVVDLKDMTVGIEEPNFWKRKHDAAVARYELREDRLLEFREAYRNRQMLDQGGLTTREPRILHFAVGVNVLFRLEPGDDERSATMLKLTFDRQSSEFRLEKRIELANPIAPSQVLVSTDGGFIITFDEIDKIGLTDNAIVIYQIETGEKMAFALEDFLSESELALLNASEHVRLWHIGGSWITYKGADFGNWQRDSQKLTGYPHIEIDVEKMEVKLAEPFVAGDQATAEASGGIR